MTLHWGTPGPCLASPRVLRIPHHHRRQAHGRHPHPAHARYDFGSMCLTPRSAYLCEVCGLQVRSQMGAHIVYASGFLRIEEVSNYWKLSEHQPHGVVDQRPAEATSSQCPEQQDQDFVQR